MKIAALSEYKGETWEIVLESGRKVFVNEMIVSDFRLFEGKEITAAELSSITSADIARKAKKRALYLLGERAFCRAELFLKLEKTYGAEVAENAVCYVEELGYINDEDYAEKYAEYLIKRKKHGVYRAKREMLQKGLSRELCENVLAEFTEEELDEELLRLIRKKYIEKIADFDGRRKTVAALVRRGYAFSAVKRCIAACLEDFDDEEFYENE